ncbi:MAG: hypothetical protein B6I26_04140 [Desulfobacteraceae bacterium 4572_130]|nr:MAG: hypothetical protein B6I26_04140 [Desulfobacteraceae bacterium 4572_130]
MNNFFYKLYKFLEQGKPIVLIKIIKQSGSTPRKPGTSCFVCENGTVIGTIGGGLLEHKIILRAKQLFKEKTSCVYNFQLTNDISARDGMICGGNVTCYLEPIFPESKETISIFKEISKLIKNGKSGTLFTLISEKPGINTPSKILMQESNYIKGRISGFDFKKIIQKHGNIPGLIKYHKDNFSIFIEPIIPEPELLLFGAGHISTFIAKLARTLNFKITVIDDRKEFANKEKFPDADNIYVLPFKNAFKQIKITQTSYIIIVTRGHAFDKIILESALNTDPAYIGMIGSTRKIKTIYNALIDQGITKEKLEKVHAPIGLKINAETPQEIAMSIIAELIKIKNSQ